MSADSSGSMDRSPESSRRVPVCLAESGAEMTMAGKTQIHAQVGEIVISIEKVESPCQSQAQLIAIQRHTFHLLEYLSQVYGRNPHFLRDLGKCPASGRVR